MSRTVPDGRRLRRSTSGFEHPLYRNTLFLSAGSATDLAAEIYVPPNEFSSNARDSVVSPDAKTNSYAAPKACRFALLVGINAYGAAGDLRGCLKDVSDWKAQLLKRGWSSSHIRVLLDAQATRACVMQGLRWLVSHCKPDDSLWFHFSGHGSWTLTPEGRGWECCICCVDCGKEWDAGIIAKTDFNAALARPDGGLVVFLDS